MQVEANRKEDTKKPCVAPEAFGGSVWDPGSWINGSSLARSSEVLLKFLLFNCGGGATVWGTKWTKVRINRDHWIPRQAKWIYKTLRTHQGIQYVLDLGRNPNLLNTSLREGDWFVYSDFYPRWNKNQINKNYLKGLKEALGKKDLPLGEYLPVLSPMWAHFLVLHTEIWRTLQVNQFGLLYRADIEILGDEMLAGPHGAMHHLGRWKVFIF